ncbi:MAG: hypothetical protein JW844_00230 [Candidatus Omnitrophica bacterium]|nr:hypothetical protein [Candidatus Omnitrophota bacterium]
MGAFLFATGTGIIVSGLIVLLVSEDAGKRRRRLATGVYTVNDFVVTYRQGVCICLVLIGAFVIFSGFDWIVRDELEKARAKHKTFEMAQVAFHAKMREEYLEEVLKIGSGSPKNIH